MNKKVKVDDIGNPPKTINQAYSEPKVSANQINDTVNFLVGRICTIVDASYADKEQAKAIKQLIKNELYDSLGNIQEWVIQSEFAAVSPFPYWSKLQEENRTS